jgi:hypothetical protein
MAEASLAAKDDELEAATSLGRIADQLEADGVEVGELRQLQSEMEALEKPPGLFKRMSKKAKNVAKQQWGHLVGELQESKEAMNLIALKMKGERELTAEETDKVRGQLLDLVRVFPAGLIAAANSAFPVPGTGVFTPWILARLGLMPSRWREAHLLSQLQQQQEVLRRTGHAAEASRLGVLRDRLEHEAEQRDAIQREARLLTHWDANNNGVWDPEERAEYAKECEQIRKKVEQHAARKIWFFEHEGSVFGPVRMSELDLSTAGALLVCFEGKTGWVGLSDVLDP